ncbi:2Fe-2S iron-sulfur cluster-binding protein [Streptomyces sp. NPDC056944]|uniref:(2Fe-2S)-binding protein n=1 Tax=Streptomyces sp. NPDC056944 TaxID=3345972 RepID=UPI003628C889
MSDAHKGQTGGWEPIPQSEGYDGDATAFVQLPPDFMLDGVPLEAPGHGYVPPMITPLQPLAPPPATDPAATGSWTVHVPTEAQQTQYFTGGEFGEGDGSFQDGSFQSFQADSFQADSFRDGSFRGGEHFQPPAYVENVVEHLDHAEPEQQDQQDPHATAEWRFEGAVAPAADPGATGQWQIPAVAEAPRPEETEPEAAVTPASYAEAPATLPGGAPAPWALPEEPAADLVEAEEPEESAGSAEASGDGAEETAPEAAPDVEAAEAPAPAPVPAPPVDASTDSDEHPHTSYTLRVNGTDRPVTGSWIGESLLYVLRERLGLAGAKDGCSQGECGACNVQVDGRLVASCLVPAATAAGSEVRTVEGLASDGEPSDVQRAMARCGTVQCGFCIPGMCMTVHDLLEGNHAPTELETRQALAGNLCRCSGYRGVLDAVRDVVAEREAAAQAGAPETAGEARVPHQIPHPHDGGMA